jgi:hypothetical protein
MNLVTTTGFVKEDIFSHLYEDGGKNVAGTGNFSTRLISSVEMSRDSMGHGCLYSMSEGVAALDLSSCVMKATVHDVS